MGLPVSSILNNNNNYHTLAFRNDRLGITKMAMFDFHRDTGLAEYMAVSDTMLTGFWLFVVKFAISHQAKGVKGFPPHSIYHPRP